MRIVIEIDGDQVSASNVPSLGEGAAPPPEVLKAAAAIESSAWGGFSPVATEPAATRVWSVLTARLVAPGRGLSPLVVTPSGALTQR